MRVSVFALGASIVAGAAAASSAKAPACVDKCWEYTKYVTNCGEDTECLCEDAEYQNAVYQCLYSQCATAYFANALHHTLAICSSGVKTDAEAPALIRQEGLKAKRDAVASDCSGSVSASAPQGSASVTRSAGGPRGSPSVSASVYLTNTGRASPSGVAPTGTPAPSQFTGAAATAGAAYGMLAVAGGMALAVLA